MRAQTAGTAAPNSPSPRALLQRGKRIHNKRQYMPQKRLCAPVRTSWCAYKIESARCVSPLPAP